MLSVGMIVVSWGSAALAQQDGGSGASAVTSNRWIVEAVIVGALFALALYVICRSSRRN